MGRGPDPLAYFHPEAKQRLNWLPTGTWANVSGSGSATYRLYRIDNKDTTGIRGIRITRATDDYYWLGYRRNFTTNSWLLNGAYIVWKRPGQSRSWLIDTTPGSTDNLTVSDRTDGSIAIGRTYADTSAHIFITPLAKGGTTPNEYLDVNVAVGTFTGNHSPTVSISGPDTLTARKTAVYTATASDPDNDKLAYSWDFGDLFTTDNNPSVPHSWSNGGTYTIKLTVSDMKGGTATAIKTVTVSDSFNTWSTRMTSGTDNITSFYGIAAGGGRVVAVGGYGYSRPGQWANSVDGTTWISGTLALNECMNGIVYDGTNFIAVGRNYDTSSASWKGSIKTSPDGSTWTKRALTGPMLNSVAYGNGIRVAVGYNGSAMRSTDGLTWSQIQATGTTASLYGVAFNNGVFLAVGNGNVIFSPDALTWTDISANYGGSKFLQTIRRLNDRFFASGSDPASSLYSSVDNGATFLNVSSPKLCLPAMAYGNGVYFAAGTNYNPTYHDSDYASTDGINWVNMFNGTLDHRKDAVFFNNTFITVGVNLTIRQSATFSSSTFSAAGYIPWREAHFPNHGADSEFNADPDGDGIPNLLEYALGRDPLNPGDGTASLPTAGIFTAQPLLADRLALQLNLPEPALSDMTYVVEVSSDLVSWMPLATKSGIGGWIWNGSGSSRLILGTLAAGRQTLYVGDDQARSTNRSRFMRLRAFITP